MTITARILRIVVPVGAAIAILLSMGGTWHVASATPPTASIGSAAVPPPKPPASPPVTTPGATTPAAKPGGLDGKLNLNTASEQQLLLLPSVGPAKADRIIEWRKKNGGFKRTADLRRVRGFGYKTFKRLEPYLDIKGDTTLHR